MRIQWRDYLEILANAERMTMSMFWSPQPSQALSDSLHWVRDVQTIGHLCGFGLEERYFSLEIRCFQY
jgi:hypothetical protein